MRIAGKVLVAAGAVLMTSCATIKSSDQPKTAYQVFVPQAAESYEQQENQVFMLGERIGEARLPAYPTELIERRLPTQTICLEIDIGEDGRVFDSRALYGDKGCDDQKERPDDRFLVATKQAVAQWTFEPARMCTYPEGIEANRNCSGKNVTVERLPVRLAFMFFFSVGKDGPQVENRALHAE